MWEIESDVYIKLFCLVFSKVYTGKVKLVLVIGFAQCLM